MTDPTTPTPPPPPAPPAPPSQPGGKKKGFSPLAWVLIGCVGLIVVAMVLAGACTFFAARKFKEVAGDVAGDFQDNPARAAAELAVKFNPDLELLESDDEAGTMTILNKRTGEEVTLNFEDIQEGRFGWKTDDGEVQFDAKGGDDGGMVTVTTPQGQTKYGAGASAGDVPGWVPVYSRARDVEVAFSTSGDQGEGGTFSAGTDDGMDTVADDYKERLEGDDYEVQVQATQAGGESQTLLIAQKGGRSVTVSLTPREGGGTQITTQYANRGD